MCHFLAVHHFGMACLAGSKVNIQQSEPVLRRPSVTNSPVIIIIMIIIIIIIIIIVIITIIIKRTTTTRIRRSARRTKIFHNLRTQYSIRKDNKVMISLSLYPITRLFTRVLHRVIPLCDVSQVNGNITHSK